MDVKQALSRRTLTLFLLVSLSDAERFALPSLNVSKEEIPGDLLIAKGF